MFDNPEYFINRELSWLKFNLRVLREAQDKRNPILERVRFIGITGSNLDEFYMIRVAGLRRHLENGVNKLDAAGFSVEEQLLLIAASTRDLVKKKYNYLRVLQKELEKENIFFSTVEELPEKNRAWTERYFNQTIYPVLTPLAVDSSHPFPFLLNRSLNLAVELRQGDETRMAVIQVPSVLPRIVETPASGRKRRFVFLEEIIRAYCGKLFHGYTVKDVAPFRITRNADLAIDEEEAEDLLAEVQRSLRQRRRGQTVRLEVARTASRTLREFIVNSLGIAEQDVYEIPGPIDTSYFMKFADLPGCSHLRYEPFTPVVRADLIGEDIFAAIRRRDILLHHPYESFSPVVEFIRRAAEDPQVLAIKQTLYRVGGDSPIVDALALAAENGKQVTVLVEVKARFDEENNILWARQLEEAGGHVIYGLVGLKTHAKIALVVRKETAGIKRYVHLSTGNYNDVTAKLYTDLGLFTANDQFGADASAFFNVSSGYSDPPVWNKFAVAPLGLRQKFYELIDREISFARSGKPAHIIAKVNSLVDKDIVRKLYEASHAGVKIDLIVRGICQLRPGIPGVSDTITVRSSVGRFLEHSRIFYFANGGDARVWLSSADWMFRNLNERVELLFPVDDPANVERLKTILDIFLLDNQKAYLMRNDGTYRRADKRAKGLNSQEEFMRRARQAAIGAELPLEKKLKPVYRKDQA